MHTPAWFWYHIAYCFLVDRGNPSICIYSSRFSLKTKYWLQALPHSCWIDLESQCLIYLQFCEKLTKGHTQIVGVTCTWCMSKCLERVFRTCLLPPHPSPLFSLLIPCVWWWIPCSRMYYILLWIDYFLGSRWYLGLLNVEDVLQLVAKQMPRSTYKCS